MNTTTAPAPETTTAGKHGYLALFNGKRAEIWTNAGTYAAQVAAAEQWGVKPKDRYKISVHLCILPNGKQVEHAADF